MKITIKSAEAKKNLEIAVKELDTKVAKMGWLGSQKYITGESVAEVAVEQEFGNPAKRIPPRPTMRPSIIKNKNKWKKIAAHYSKKVIKGEATPYILMEALGAAAAGDERAEIVALKTPPLSPVTIQKRAEKRGIGKDQISDTLRKPLVDSGIMLATVTHSVEDK